jgi:hypothetical protein
VTDTVHALIGVYNAEGTIRGELSYLFGKFLGRAHCALCDITHGLATTKPAWQQCRLEIPVHFETVHLDERDDGLAALTEGRTACVVADLGDRREILLGPEDLDACHGEPEALVQALNDAVASRGWEWADTLIG